MAVVYISEAEAVRDFASVLAQVRAGTEVVIENQASRIALVKPAVLEAEEPESGHGSVEGPEAGYSEWFVAQVDEALADPRPSMDSEVVEAYFAKRRSVSALRIAGLPG